MAAYQANRLAAEAAEAARKERLAAQAIEAAWKTEEEYEREFQNFVDRFRKGYKTEERDARFTVFKNSYKLFASENAKGNSYQLSINEFADMTPNGVGRCGC